MYCNDNAGWFPTCAYPESTAFRHYPDDWVHWQANQNIDDSAIAKYVGYGDQLKSVLRCPADDFADHPKLTGIAPGQGPYLYSYSMNDGLAENVSSGEYRTRMHQWRSPSRKIMLTEAWEKYPAAGWAYPVPLTQRHGSERFHGNVPGNPELAFGTKRGANASAVFLDGHADSIDQDFAFDPAQGDLEAR